MGRHRGNRSGWVEEEYPNTCSKEATRPERARLDKRYETVIKKMTKPLRIRRMAI